MAEADLDLSAFRSNTFQMEWPPRSGRQITAPECDRAAYFAPPEALVKILDYQRGFVEEAAARLSGGAA
jgi:predicted NUDIX family NTP pyrophosphohydrolase